MRNSRLRILGGYFRKSHRMRERIRLTTMDVVMGKKKVIPGRWMTISPGSLPQGRRWNIGHIIPRMRKMMPKARNNRCIAQFVVHGPWSGKRGVDFFQARLRRPCNILGQVEASIAQHLECGLEIFLAKHEGRQLGVGEWFPA
jgi:hypothetical protein